ncbi:MAG TPA: PD-(D/E)XK nuclease family protein [Vicinamibacterales bacterium]
MQYRRLVRSSTLAGFRQTLIELALSGGPLEARRRAIIVPTRASAELLRRTIETASVQGSRRAIVLPDFLTRDEWMSRLHVALPGAAPLLGRAGREMLLARAARAAAGRPRMGGAPFHLRPGLVAAMLDLYDELQRRQRSVRRFARSMFDQLRVERGTDRGSEGLIHQTAFLGFAFLGYQRGVAESGSMDEHVLRRRLIDTQPGLPFDHVVIAVGDRPLDPRGLWPADFDLIGRLRTLGAVDVVVTDETHDAGFRERAERELPGLTEARSDVRRERPVVLTPAGPDAEAVCFVSRDREEELRDVARAIRARAGTAASTLREPTAIVFHRPLPYLYLAQHVLDDAAVPYQAFDALPLASEPYAALLDLVLGVARTGGTREAMSALLRSRLMQFRDGPAGDAVTGDDVAALDFALAERRAIGEADTYLAEVDGLVAQRRGRMGFDPDRARRAARVAACLRDELMPYRRARTASDQVSSISRFLRRHEREVPADDSAADRQVRARAAVLSALDDLSRACRRHDDDARPHDDLTALVHHQIESQTFAPRRGRRGVHLVDAVAARFGEFDHTHLVGLVESDWPERPVRSIFYTSGLLKALGWAQEPDHMRAQQAAFRDLLGLAKRTTTLHAFQLDGDAIVARSPLIDAARKVMPGVFFRAVEAADGPRAAIFADEMFASDAAAGVLPAGPRDWLALRRRRPAATDRRYRGFVAALEPRPYRVSRVDRYVDCPFKYFSETVLGLPEEREEMSGLTPLERGTLVHELFERFYRTWHQQGGGTITPSSLPEAIALFASQTRQALSRLPEPDRALEETRLLGSIVARGLAERVFELESDAGGRIVDRLLEFDLRGPFTFPQLLGLKQRTIEIRGKADRVDVFDDGSVRVIDYKLGKLPDAATSVQIGVYAHCVRAVLGGRDGREHPVKSAMYLAFGDDRKLEGSLGSPSQPADLAVTAHASDFASIVDRIEAGEFPPRPLRPNECQWCRYALVCRKEYAPESDEAAESL